jgi:hypothetical protein
MDENGNEKGRRKREMRRKEMRSEGDKKREAEETDYLL